MYHKDTVLIDKKIHNTGTKRVPLMGLSQQLRKVVSGFISESVRDTVGIDHKPTFNNA